MNRNNLNLFFTVTYDYHKVDFLEVSILKDENGTVTSKLFRKDTAGNMLLHANSFHPKSLKKSIPFSQFLRIKSNCTTDIDFQLEADALTSRLLARGYTKSRKKKAFNHVKIIRRQDLIFNKKENNKEDNTTRIILRIRRILMKYCPILTEDPILGNLVTKNPQITYKKAGSIDGKLVQNEYKGDSRGDPCKTGGDFPMWVMLPMFCNQKEDTIHIAQW